MVVRAIRANEGVSVENHFFTPINVVEDNLNRAAGYFEGNSLPVAVVHEGLLIYLDLEEQARVRDNIAEFLRDHSRNGAWITPDFAYTSSSAILLDCYISDFLIQ